MGVPAVVVTIGEAASYAVAVLKKSAIIAAIAYCIFVAKRRITGA